MPFAFCDKLPSRLEWNMFHGDFDQYENALYAIFKRDFLNCRPSYLGKPVDVIHERYYKDKERSFWHIVTSGEEDFSRSFDSDRCGSIPWVKALIEEADSCNEYKTWIKWHDKTKKDRYYIWCSKVNYIVILEERNEYFKLITAYNVLPYKIERYQKDYDTYKRTKTPT